MCLNCAFITFGIQTRLNGIGGDVVRKALAHQKPDEFFESTRLGNTTLREQSRCASQVVLHGEKILGIAGDIIEYDMAALELSLNLALPPAASFAFLDKVRTKAVLI